MSVSEDLKEELKNRIKTDMEPFGINQIGTAGDGNRKLGFIPGPFAFDQTDEEVRELMRQSFGIALQKNIAVGFHIDDSMFWGRLSSLNTPENMEWLQKLASFTIWDYRDNINISGSARRIIKDRDDKPTEYFQMRFLLERFINRREK